MNNNLVFLHGFLGHPEDFEMFSKTFENFKCVSINLNLAPGFALKAQAQFLYSELKRHKIKKAHFWGYSMGGRVLLEAYKRFPELFKSLVLESTSPGITDKTERDLRTQSDTKWAKLITEDADLFLKEWYSQELFQEFKQHPEFLRLNTTKREKLTSLHAKMIIEASPGANPSHFEVIENIKIPTLALVGQFDKKYGQIWGKLIDKNPEIAIQIVPHSGHVVHIENPTGAKDLFLNFHREKFCGI